MLVEFGCGASLWQSIEVGEQVGLRLCLRLSLLTLAQQVVDDGFRVNILLDTKRRRIGGQLRRPSQFPSSAKPTADRGRDSVV